MIFLEFSVYFSTLYCEFFIRKIVMIWPVSQNSSSFYINSVMPANSIPGLFWFWGVDFLLFPSALFFFIISKYFFMVEQIRHNSEERAALNAPPGWGRNRAAPKGEMGFLCEQAFSGALAFIYFRVYCRGKKILNLWMKAQDALRLVKIHNVFPAVKLETILFFHVTGLLIYEHQIIISSYDVLQTPTCTKQIFFFKRECL